MNIQTSDKEETSMTYRIIDVDVSQGFILLEETSEESAN